MLSEPAGRSRSLRLRPTKNLRTQVFYAGSGQQKGGPPFVGPPRFVLLLDPLTETGLAEFFVLFLIAAVYGIDDGTSG